MKRLAYLLLLGSAVAGCGKRSEHFPLRVGDARVYEVEGGFVAGADEVRVADTTTILDHPGFALEGAFGPARVAWVGDTLLAEDLANTRFRPPIPILVEDLGKPEREWRGAMVTMGRLLNATATLVQEPKTLDLGSRKYQTIHALLSISAPGTEIEVSMWYAKGIGPVRWEERINQVRVLKADYVSGK
ncbi:MAG: hypothetical protein KIS66_03510 [Fimbriimonadaceae bacterium]|nr:hypothetical protein [Fimbriimonadaceae bacterium]